MPLFLIFIIIPLIEIGIFIEVGEEIGLGATLLLCFLTALIGATLIRAQGIQAWLAAQKALQQSKMPVAALFDGICLVIAGALLLTPGFFTDTIGFFLLAPPFRAWLRTKGLPGFLHRAGYTTSASYSASHTEYEDKTEQERVTIEGEYEVIDNSSEDR